MYNNGKPHHALNKMSPVQYRNARSVETVNNSPQVPSYFPVSTEKQYQHLNLMNKKNNKLMSNPVNVI
jgi:hypothetical protein